jgi:hypothetical protein
MSKKLICWVSFTLVLGVVLTSGAKAADPNLVGQWPLNEGAGETVVDVSGNGNDGTINNPNGGLGVDGSVWIDDPVLGTVISFSGEATGAYVRAGSIPQMTLTNDFTWAFWAKQDAGNTTANDIIFGNRKDENAVDFVPRQFIKFTPTKFEWHMNGNGDDNLDYDDIPADVWLHHAVVKTGDQLTYYRNGVASNTGTITQALDFPQPLFMGGDNENADGENWRGSLSDARIYNKALTKLEILAVMKGLEKLDMEVGYAVKAPVIDGEVDYVWEGASEVYFVPLEDADDGSGTWKVLYDEENLYVMVDITDDSLQNDSASAWQDDSVEIYFDGGNTKLTTPLSGDDHQYTFGWTADDIQGTNIDGYTEGIEQAQVTTDTGWRIEVKMPWLSIQGAAPQAGDLIGIDCYYNDDDDGGDSREGKMLSFSPIEGWNDASQWGTAILANIPEPVDPGTEGMIAYYAFENDANDSSVNGLNGVIMGDPVFAEGPAGYGMALDFDGDGDYVDCGNDAMFSVTDALTVSVWINWRAPGAQWQTIIAKGDNAWRLARNSDSQGMDFGFDDGSRGWISASTASDVPLNEWHQLTATYDTIDGAKIYLDGVLEGTNADTTGITTGDYPVFIGDNSQQTGRYWDGLIDEVMIYSRALSNGEILYLAGERAEAGDPSLSIYYTFDEVSDVVADQSGNGLDGVVVGDVTADAEGMLVGAAKFANAGYLDLDGANVPAEDIPTTGMTLAAWIKCEDTGDHHAIFNARASDETWVVHPEARSDGTFRWLLRSYGGTTMFDIRAGVVTWGEWEHFAGTYDEASAKATLTINGEVVSEMDVASPDDIAGDWGMGARVGKNIDDARPFTGLMDEFRLFTRALSQDEIVDMMAGM